MTEPVNNPPDHKHDDYLEVAGAALIIAIVAMMLLIFMLFDDSGAPRLDRLEEQVCAMVTT